MNKPNTAPGGAAVKNAVAPSSGTKSRVFAVP